MLQLQLTREMEGSTIRSPDTNAFIFAPSMTDKQNIILYSALLNAIPDHLPSQLLTHHQRATLDGKLLWEKIETEYGYAVSTLAETRTLEREWNKLKCGATKTLIKYYNHFHVLMEKCILNSIILPNKALTRWIVH